MTSVIHHYSVNYSFEDIDLTQLAREADACEAARPVQDHRSSPDTPNRITPCLGV